MSSVSVIVCCYNDGRYLARALNSLCQQTLSRDQFQLVLVNDGSSDETEAVARSFSGKLNLDYLKHDVNKGLAASCNLGIQHARGEYVIRLDADDTFASTILEEMSAAMSSNAAGLIYSDRIECLEATAETRYVSLSEFSIFKLIACATMLRTEKLKEIGGYRSLFWEEYDLYMRYLSKSDKKPFYIPRPLYRYTIHSGSMTADPARINAGWEELRALWPESELAKFGPLPFSCGS